MKRGRLIFLTIIIFLIIAGAGILIKITGKATQQITMNIPVTAPPALTLISPKNQTYLINASILLNYSVSDEVWVKYSLDSGNNVTVTSSTYFNASEGSHTLYLYANNSDGLRIRSVNFSVDSTLFNIIHEEYKNSKKGNSTNFTIFSHQELQNLSDLVLENTDFGKMKFNEIINLTDDENPSDNITNISAHINISSNRIEINSSTLPNFNKSATLHLYGLITTNPRILRNGIVCPSEICTGQVYSGGTLKFNVTQFTVYSSEETPAEAAPAPSPGGGGVSVKKSFTIDKETLSISLKQGETEKDFFIIKNTGNIAMSFSITNQKLDEFLKINEPSFSLGAGKSKRVELNFLARAETIPTLYLGKIFVKGDGITKEILTSIEVESKRPLFDVKIEIPPRFTIIPAGEELLTNIKIFNIGRGRTGDVFVEYKIRDEQGNSIYSESETVFVETQTTFTKSFKIPEYVKNGKYIVYVRTTYNGEVASSTVFFNVGKETFFTLKTILVMAGAILGIIILIIILRKLGKIKIKPLIKLKIKKPKLKKLKKKKGESFRSYKRRIRERLRR